MWVRLLGFLISFRFLQAIAYEPSPMPVDDEHINGGDSGRLHCPNAPKIFNKGAVLSKLIS
jgi:hypothetical protein